MTHVAYSDIVFSWEGKLYVSGDLIQISTDDERRPAIFVEPNQNAAFLLQYNEISILEIVSLSARQLRMWSDHCPDSRDVEALLKCIHTLELRRKSKAGQTHDFGSPAFATKTTQPH